MPIQKFAPMSKDFPTFDCDAHVTEPPWLWERARDYLTADELHDLVAGLLQLQPALDLGPVVARHLDARGHKLTCLGRGPDFRFEHDGVTVWVEAIAPEPRGKTKRGLISTSAICSCHWQASCPTRQMT